jgi:hypothetical protein
VSKSVVTPTKLRWALHIPITAGLFAILYKYWLTTPVLQHVSIGYWRPLAILVAAVCGAALSLLRVPAPALSFGAIAGLLIGGTLAALKVQHDVAVSIYGAFTGHLESLWREVLTLAGTATLAAVCCNYFLRPDN